VVKFELLADLEDVPAEAQIRFDGCSELGAVNLRGTGYAARDVEERTLRGDVDGTEVVVTLLTTGLAGYPLAKTHAARVRRAPKDLYDLVLVLLHHGPGGPVSAVEAIRRSFPGSRWLLPAPLSKKRWRRTLRRPMTLAVSCTPSRCSSTIRIWSGTSLPPTPSPPWGATAERSSLDGERLGLPPLALSCHGEQLSGPCQLTALLFEFAAQIGDEGQEAVRVAPQRSGVSGPLHLVSQQPPSLVAFSPSPPGGVLGGSGALLRLLDTPLSPLSAQSPVLSLLLGPLRLPASLGRLSTKGPRLVADRLGPGQLCPPPLAVGTLPLCLTRPFSRAPTRLPVA
jgi:hypothetical protein